MNHNNESPNHENANNSTRLDEGPKPIEDIDLSSIPKDVMNQLIDRAGKAHIIEGDFKLTCKLNSVEVLPHTVGDIDLRALPENVKQNLISNLTPVLGLLDNGKILDLSTKIDSVRGKSLGGSTTQDIGKPGAN